jgi:histidine triad (HIT) family protein
MSDDCLFCGIARGTIPSTKEYEDDTLVVFADIHPVAPVHLLVIPRKHIASVADLSDVDRALISEMVMRAKDIAAKKGIAKDGYRLVFNVRDHGGQVVDHIHLHIIGGAKLGPMARAFGE